MHKSAMIKGRYDHLVKFAVCGGAVALIGFALFGGGAERKMEVTMNPPPSAAQATADLRTLGIELRSLSAAVSELKGFFSASAGTALSQHQKLVQAVSSLQKSVETSAKSSSAALAAAGPSLSSSLPSSSSSSSASSSDAGSSGLSLLPFPKTVKYLYINIGTSYDPEPACAHSGVPHAIAYDPEIFCLYVEPLFRVHEALRKRGYDNNSTLLIHAAVSNQTGIATFHEYAGRYGAASSLSEVSEETAKKDKNGPFSEAAKGLSPTIVITLKSILDAIPKHIRIVQLKTDMQGYDFTALSSAGKDLLRVEEIYNECVARNGNEQYAGIDNSYATWNSYMQSVGFTAGCPRIVEGQFKKDILHDCFWVRSGPNKPKRVKKLKLIATGCRAALK